MGEIRQMQLSHQMQLRLGITTDANGGGVTTNDIITKSVCVAATCHRK